MDLIVEKSGEITGNITPGPSKFYTQYASAVSLLTDGKNVINSPLLVDDTRELVKALETMGATSKRSKKKWSVWGTGLKPEPSGQVVDAKKSIMSLSLLTALSALASRIMVVTGKKQVRSRPVPSLLKALNKLGVDAHSTKSDDTPPLVIFESDISGGKKELEKDTDPRFIPAFLLLSPYPEEKVELKLQPEFKNPRTDMAVKILKESGIDVSMEEDSLIVSPGEYETLEVKPPLDIFSVVPFVSAAILTKSEIKITKVNESVKVEEFLSFLEDLGIKKEIDSDSMEILPSQNLTGKEYSLKKYPELLPFAAVLACRAQGKTRIVGAERARNMKTDRISAMVEGLGRMGAEIEEKDDGLVVEGPVKLEGAKVNGHKDDAVVAALGVAGLVSGGKTIVKNRAETLRESYPKFVSTFRDLGGEIGYSS